MIYTTKLSAPIDTHRHSTDSITMQITSRTIVLSYVAAMLMFFFVTPAHAGCPAGTTRGIYPSGAGYANCCPDDDPVRECYWYNAYSGYSYSMRFFAARQYFEDGRTWCHGMDQYMVYPESRTEAIAINNLGGVSGGWWVGVKTWGGGTFSATGAYAWDYPGGQNSWVDNNKHSSEFIGGSNRDFVFVVEEASNDPDFGKFGNTVNQLMRVVCKTRYCYGISYKSSSVCSGRGACTYHDTCSCNSGWTGAMCEKPVCGGLAPDHPDVCSRHGTCTNPDTCSCTGGWMGTLCSYTTCYTLENTNPMVCSAHGECIGLDNCQCNSGWQGAACQTAICDGLPATDPSVCSGTTRGKCIGPDACFCESGYDGNKCQYTLCYGISNKFSTVCSGHGTCDSPNVCTCQSGWFNYECQHTNCYGLRNDMGAVCSGHGTCNGPDDCQCIETWGGQQCQHPKCFGIAADDPTVCSGHGQCTGVDTCSCSTGFTGTRCETAYCYGKINTDQNACGGVTRGTCVGPDNCQCNSEYTGNECQLQVCNGIASDSPSVCSGHGSCNSPGMCTCQSGWGTSGDFCAWSQCNGLTNPQGACGGHGSCVAPEQCQCSDTNQWRGPYCQHAVCLGYTNIDSTLVCNGGRGTCQSPNICNCRASWGGNLCEYPVCFSKISTDQDVCNGHGACTTPGVCACDSGWGSADCSGMSCGGVLASSSQACSGHGTCIDPDVCACTNDTAWTGSLCQYAVCNGLPGSDPNACPGFGACVSPDVCNCLPGYTESSGCNTPVCYGKESTDPEVCSGHGTCTSPDICECNVGWGGDQCHLPICYNKRSDEDGVCSNHGTCILPDTCSCQTDWTNLECQTPICYGKMAIDVDNVCSGRGSCTAPNTCVCPQDTTGPQCETNVCFGELATDLSVCSGHGACSEPGFCECVDEWGGSRCNIPVPCVETKDIPELPSDVSTSLNNNVYMGQVTGYAECQRLLSAIYRGYKGFVEESPASCSRLFDFDISGIVSQNLLRYATPTTFLDTRCPSYLNPLTYTISNNPALPSDQCIVSSTYTPRQIADSLTSFGTIANGIKDCGALKFIARTVRVPQRYSLSVRYQRIKTTVTGFTVSTSMEMTTKTISVFLNVTYAYMIKIPLVPPLYSLKTIFISSGTYQESNLNFDFRAMKLRPLASGGRGPVTIIGQGHALYAPHHVFQSIIWTRQQGYGHIPIFYISSQSMHFLFDDCAFQTQFSEIHQAPMIEYYMCGNNVDYASLYQGLQLSFYSDPLTAITYTSAIVGCSFSGVKSLPISFSYRADTNTLAGACSLSVSAFNSPSAGYIRHDVLIRGNTFVGITSKAFWIEQNDTPNIANPACKCLRIGKVHVIGNAIQGDVSGSNHQYALIGYKLDEISSKQDSSFYGASEEMYSLSSVSFSSNTITSARTTGIAATSKMIQLTMSSNSITFDRPVSEAQSPIYSSVMYADIGSGTYTQQKASIVIRDNHLISGGICQAGQDTCFSSGIHVRTVNQATTSTFDMRDNAYEDTSFPTVDIQQVSSFVYGTHIKSSGTAADFISILEATYGVIVLTRTETGFQEASLNIRQRNMLLTGNLYDVYIEIDHLAQDPSQSPDIIKRKNCEITCKGYCGWCVVDVSRVSDINSGYCYDITKFITLQNAAAKCEHGEIRLLPTLYSGYSYTFSRESLVIGSLPQPITAGPLAPTVPIYSRARIHHGSTFVPTTAEPLPHPIYMNTRNIEFRDVDFLLSPVDINEPSFYVLFSRSSSSQYLFISSAKFTNCSFISTTSFSELFSLSLFGNIGALSLVNSTVQNWGFNALPGRLFTMTLTNNNFTQLNRGIANVVVDSGFNISNNVGRQLGWDARGNAILKISNTPCSAPLGCTLKNNDFVGVFADVTFQDTFGRDLKTVYGTSSIYDLESIDTPVSSFLDLSHRGASYGIRYRNMPQITCDQPGAKSLRTNNLLVKGIIADIICQQGLPEEYSCYGACLPPRPPPAECIVDPSFSTTSDNYLYSEFQDVQTAVSFCASQPTMIIRVVPGKYLDQTLIPRRQSAQQTGISIRKFDPLSTDPVIIVGHGHVLTSDFGSTYIEGIWFHTRDFDDPNAAASSDASSMFSGSVMALTINSCIFRSVANPNASVATSADGKPDVMSLFSIMMNSTLVMTNNKFYGASTRAITITDAKIAEPSVSTSVTFTNNQGKVLLGSFLELVGSQSVVITGNECTSLCGGLADSVASVIYVDFKAEIDESMGLKYGINMQFNKIAASSVQYGNPFSSSPGYLAGFWINRMSPVNGPASVAEFMLRNNTSTGYPIGTRVSNIPNNIIEMNEPPGWPTLFYDAKRSIRELARLNNNNLQGTVWDVKNGAPTMDSILGGTNACNDLCVPGSGAYCRVHSGYSSTDMGWDMVVFRTVNRAIDRCIIHPLVIVISQAAPSTADHPRDSIYTHTEQIYFKENLLYYNDDIVVRGEINKYTRKPPKLVGNHRFARGSVTGTTTTRIILQDLELVTNSSTGYVPSVPMIFVETINPQYDMLFSILFKNILVTNGGSTPASSIIDLNNIGTSASIAIDNVQVDVPILKDSGSIIEIKYGTGCGTASVTVKRLTTLSSSGGALWISNSQSVGMTLSTLGDCGWSMSTTSPACVRLSMCNVYSGNREDANRIVVNQTVIEGPRDASEDSSRPTSARYVERKISYAGNNASFSAMLIEIQPTYPQPTTPIQASDPLPMFLAKIKNLYMRRNWYVGLRIMGWDWSSFVATYTEYADNIRAPVRNLSVVNPKIDAVFADVILSANDQDVSQRQLPNSYLFCKDGCPDADNSRLLRTVVILVAVFLSITILSFSLFVDMSWLTGFAGKDSAVEHVPSKSLLDPILKQRSMMKKEKIDG